MGAFPAIYRKANRAAGYAGARLRGNRLGLSNRFAQGIEAEIPQTRHGAGRGIGADSPVFCVFEDRAERAM
jgi:hypothetical protein